MKSLTIAAMIFLINFVSFCQDLADGPQRELYIYPAGFPTNPLNVVNTIDTFSIKYCRANESNEIGLFCSDCHSPSSVTISNYVNSGWNICKDYPGPFPYFGYSFYRMTNSYTNDFFYLDFRDCNYAPSGEYGNLWTDLSIYLNLNYDGNGHSRYEYKVQSNPSVAIINGEVIRIWEIEYLSPPQPYVPKTDCFTDFWQNCLVLIPTSDNHPRLVWGPYPERKQLSCSLFC